MRRGISDYMIAPVAPLDVVRSICGLFSVPEAKAGDADGIGRYRMQFPETSARYLKVVAQNAAAIPAWHPGAGSKGFLFVDEVVVE